MASLQLSSSEIQIIQTNELELFKTRYPQVGVRKYRGTESNSTTQRLGSRTTPTWDEVPISVHADYDRERKLNELREGVWIKTNRIKVRFCVAELQEISTTIGTEFSIQKSDLIVFPVLNSQQVYEIQSSEYENFIPSVHVPLHITAIIDIEHVFTE